MTLSPTAAPDVATAEAAMVAEMLPSARCQGNKVGRKATSMSEYEQKGEEFLSKHGLKFRATCKGDKCPPWNEGNHERASCSCGAVHGDFYRITISRKGGGRLSFDFWNSQKDMYDGKHPTAYNVLACISSDAYCPDNFEDFCGEYGYEQDSRRAFATFKRCATFAERIQAFLSEEELKDLGTIQ